MRAIVVAVIGVICFTGFSVAKNDPPKVQVYTRKPLKIGEANTLICHTGGFHPPEITIDLLRNGVNMTDTKQTDLAFDDHWHYHLTKHAPFTPNGERFTCKVTHLGISKVYDLESDM